MTRRISMAIRTKTVVPIRTMMVMALLMVLMPVPIREIWVGDLKPMVARYHHPTVIVMALPMM